MTLPINRVSWDTGQQSYSKIKEEIKIILANRTRPISDPIEVRQIIDRLWRYVTDTIATDASKSFKYEDIGKILDQETAVSIDRKVVQDIHRSSTDTNISIKHIEKGLGALIQQISFGEKEIEEKVEIKPYGLPFLINLPPLPKFCSDRTELLDTIIKNCSEIPLIWCFGSTGYGKTTIANLFIRKSNRHFLWYGLKGITDFNLTSILQPIIKIIDRYEKRQALIVFDDLIVDNRNTYLIELLHIISDILYAKDSQLIVTSQYQVPSRLKINLKDKIYILDVPEMTISDIKWLLKSSGLTDDKKITFCSNYILAMTGGHPQLVSAYVIYLKEIEWNISIHNLTFRPQSVEEIKRESRKILADTILSNEARELARRLSVIKGSFERDFALNLGSAGPSLNEPGYAFDSLIGPWVEEDGENMYSLSPLLDNYAEAEFGQEGLKGYHKIACHAWYKQKSITIHQCSQLLLSALFVGEEPLIVKFCHSLINFEAEKFKHIAKHLSFVNLMYINTEDQLVDIDPLTKFIFRFLQLKISVANSDWHAYNKIDKTILKELDEIKSHPFYLHISQFFCIYTVIHVDSPIPVKEKIIRALNILDTDLKEWHNRFLSEVSPLEETISIIISAATAQLELFDDLKFLFDQLKQLKKDKISIIFSEIEDIQESWTLLIDRVWLKESTQENPQWNNLLSLLQDIINFAKKYKYSWLIASAASGRMVIFDEYLNKPEKALKEAVEIRKVIGESHPLLDLAESIVWFRLDNYIKTIELIENIEKSLPLNILAFRRLFSLRRGLICAEKIGDPERVEKFATKGYELSKEKKDYELWKVAEIAFQAEIGWAYHISKNIPKASEYFSNALNKLEQFENQNYSYFRILNLRFGHAIGWLGNIWDRETTSFNNNTHILYEKPFAGMFANLEIPPEESLDYPFAPYQLSWSLIANYASQHVDTFFVKSCAKRAMHGTDDGQYYLAVSSAWKALFTNQLLSAYSA